MKPEFHEIEGPWRGKLMLARRPRGYDWLEDELKSWRESGIGTVVSFLTAEEENELGLTGEARLSGQIGITFLSFPIQDRSVPCDRAAAMGLLRDLERSLIHGESVALHCRQGLGRSALMAASLLVGAGMEPEAAFHRVSESRGSSVPETPEQRDWVRRLARQAAPAR